MEVLGYSAGISGNGCGRSSAGAVGENVLYRAVALLV